MGQLFKRRYIGSFHLTTFYLDVFLKKRILPPLYPFLKKVVQRGVNLSRPTAMRLSIGTSWDNLGQN